MLTPISGGEAPQTRGRRFAARAIHPHLEALVDQVRRAETAGEILLQILEVERTGEQVERIMRLDSESHGFNQQLTGRLSASFITPLDPEDVQSVSTALTRVVQAMRRAAEVARDLPARRRLASAQRQINTLLIELGDAVRTLAEGEPAVTQAAGVLRSQREARAALRSAGAVLVRTDSDVLQLLAEQQLYASLDDVLYRVRKTATSLQSLILKNG